MQRETVKATETVGELTDDELEELLGPRSEFAWRARIDVQPGILGGKPRVKETRIGVDLLLDWLAAGWSEADVLENYPFLSADDVRMALAFAAETVRIDRGRATGIANDPSTQVTAVAFVADENFPRNALAILRSSGLDIAWVVEFAPMLPDESVLAAAREQARVLLTFDNDFGRLVYRSGVPPPPGVVLFRARPGTEREVAMRLFDLRRRHGFRLDGFLTVVTLRDERQRPLPEANDDRGSGRGR